MDKKQEQVVTDNGLLDNPQVEPIPSPSKLARDEDAAFGIQQPALNLEGLDSDSDGISQKELDASKA